ncbi:MAG: hypothetical protein HOV80_11330 [Polyangiaceae bacterium]|nr:hypothetical protein [Polyangiaceae bacterium]
MRTGKVTLVALFVAGCSEVRIEDGGSGGSSSTDAASSSASSSVMTSTTTGPAVSASATTTGAGGGEPQTFAICGGVPDTFDVEIDDMRWNLAPMGTATVDQGEVVLTGAPGYLQLEAPAVDCAFTFEVLSVDGEFVELEVIGPDSHATGVRAMGEQSGLAGVVGFLYYDGGRPIGQSFPDMPLPLGLGLVFRGNEIGYFARLPSGWTFLAAMPRPRWVDDTGPEVRFIGFDPENTARIDDYGVHPIPVDAWPSLKD